jgi:DNA-binding MarR family transcriptional regulator
MESKMTAIMQSTIADEDRSALSTLAAALKPFRDLGSVSPSMSSMPVSIVATFLAVAKREGRTVSEYAKTANVSLTNMSKQLSDLSEKNRYGTQGLGLIEQRVEIHDRRIVRNRLTEKGRTFARQVAEAMRGRQVREAA